VITTDVPVIDICVKAGDVVKVDDALVTLESDKATMDVPSSAAGVVKEIRVAARRPDLRRRGRRRHRSVRGRGRRDVAPLADSARRPATAGAAPVAPVAAPASVARSSCRGRGAADPLPPLHHPPVAGLPLRRATHASPSVRLLARELGVDLGKVSRRADRKAASSRKTSLPTSRAS
jgi:pyruvate dehydrogenase E2 component (dihydrolipoamide acetyltransferase)